MLRSFDSIRFLVEYPSPSGRIEISGYGEGSGEVLEKNEADGGISCLCCLDESGYFKEKLSS